MTDLTSDGLSEKIRDIQNVNIRGFLHSESFIFVQEIFPVIGSVAKLRHFVTVWRFTYDVIGK